MLDRSLMPETAFRQILASYFDMLTGLRSDSKHANGRSRKAHHSNGSRSGRAAK
jgi:hypothetical protein